MVGQISVMADKESGAGRAGIQSYRRQKCEVRWSTMSWNRVAEIIVRRAQLQKIKELSCLLISC